MKPKVVFDTNIYIRKLLTPGGGGDKLFALFLRKKFDLYTSRYQLEEIAGVVTGINAEGRRSIAEEDLESLITALIRRANLVPTSRQNKVSPDPDDDWIIGIAIKAKAAYLVSENPKDIYQNLMPKTPPIQVLSVKQALDLWKPRR